MSHPVWVRGLKHNLALIVSAPAKSHPVWVRGLKPQRRCGEQVPQRVAPRVGAWIETS